MVGFLMVLVAIVAATTIPKRVASWSCDSPAFLHAQDGALFVTQFSGSPFTAGSIAVAYNVSSTSSAPQFTTAVSSYLLWPNEMTSVPGAQRAFVVGDGFLPPGKSTGSVSLVEWSSGGAFNLTKLTVDKSNWFYHKAVFVDVNDDGLLDVLTARAVDSVIVGGQGELLWLEAPAWTEHHLAFGPDINFDVLWLASPGTTPLIVFAAEFFAQKLTAWRVEKGGVVSQNAVIDDSIGEVYDVRVVSLNNTSPTSLLVTNYRYSSTGSLFIYDLGSLAQPSSFTRTTVYDQFQNVQYLVGSGAPGFIYAHWPSTTPAAGERPNIFVSGDGAEAAYLFTPVAGGGLNNYTLSYSKSFGSTVGAMLVHDWLGRGRNQVLIGLYDINQIEVYSY